MTYLSNEHERFAEEALAGFAAAHSHHVRPVRGGVVRATQSAPGQVAVVVGGGSGHYPAFAGWVGPGFAHGSPVGNIFASPAAVQILEVARAADNGGGVILGYGNYAGDVLHFGQAAEILNAQGIETRVLPVTDDLASAPQESWQSRRGIAGDLPVLKIAAAAAEDGLPLDEVLAVGRRANAATKSLGVAFEGCTLPGADQPLFTQPSGTMGIGVGIHGEPGIDEVALSSADEIANRLADGILAETDVSTGRVLAILNGLGSTKYEELFVVYRRVAERLAEAGIDVAYSEVGELVTSLDMAGISLTLTVLDDELERYWAAACDTPAFSQGHVPERTPRTDDLTARGRSTVDPGTADSQRAAVRIMAALRAARDVIDAEANRLGELDAAAGDGDHGIGMSRGAQAAVEAGQDAAEAGGGAKSVLLAAGEAWSERGGGTSGALWGALLVTMGQVLGNEHPVEVSTVDESITAGIDAIQRLGGARPGDKTLLDAAVPFRDAFTSAPGSLSEKWVAATEKATDAAEQTAQLSAKVGRARVYGSKSEGIADPGAVSFAHIATAVGRVLSEPSGSH